MSLEARGAVVTGGGRGIGAAVARSLAEARASVVVCARTEREIEVIADELSSAGKRAWAVPCDVTDPKSVRAMAEAALKRLESVDILVNSAGMAFSAPVHKMTLQDWNRLLAVNATGPFLCTQALLPGMVERKWGRVINIASVAAKSGAKYISGYAASKHAVLGFTRSVAEEVAASGITVNAVCPGYVDTEMTRESLERIVASTGLSYEEALAAILDTTPQKRLITPEEVAAAVVWLCGDSAGGVNGQPIVMDGGGLRA